MVSLLMCLVEIFGVLSDLNIEHKEMIMIDLKSYDQCIFIKSL